MTIARPLPQTGSVYVDSRGGGRAMRVSFHLDRDVADPGLVVLSLWRDNVCTGSFRLSVDEVPDLIDLLRAGLDGAYRSALSVAE